MRRMWALLTLGVSAIFLLGEIQAQTTGATGNLPNFSTGFTPGTRTLRPINPSNAMSPTGGFKNAAQQPFGLGKVFPKISLGKWPPTLPTGSFLSKSPYQSKSTGYNPFAPKAK